MSLFVPDLTLCHFHNQYHFDIFCLLLYSDFYLWLTSYKDTPYVEVLNNICYINITYRQVCMCIISSKWFQEIYKKTGFPYLRIIMPFTQWIATLAVVLDISLPEFLRGCVLLDCKWQSTQSCLCKKTKIQKWIEVSYGKNCISEHLSLTFHLPHHFLGIGFESREDTLVLQNSKVLPKEEKEKTAAYFFSNRNICRRRLTGMSNIQHTQAKW